MPIPSCPLALVLKVSLWARELGTCRNGFRATFFSVDSLAWYGQEPPSCFPL